MKDLETIRKYKNHFASRYQFLTKEELKELPAGQLFVSKKYDGFFCCAIVGDGKSNELVLPNGDSISSDLSVVSELKKIKFKTKVLVAGELFVKKTDGRERSGDVKSSLSSKSDDLSFVAFDIVESVEDVDTYQKKLDLMKGLFSGHKMLSSIDCQIQTAKEIPDTFDKLITEEKNEGIVIRNDSQVYKVKNEIDLDCVVLGYTINQSKNLRSITIGLVIEENTFLHVGSVGNFDSAKIKDELLNKLTSMHCVSSYRLISSDGTQYQFVTPEVIVEINSKDIQNELSNGEPLQHMSFNYQDNKLLPIHETPSVSILHAKVKQIRADKEVVPDHCGLIQIEKAGFYIKDMKTDPSLSIDNLKESEILTKEVYTKESKGKTMIKKFLILQTNKESFTYPKYLFYFFDFSESRKDQIKRDVRPFFDLDMAKELMGNYLETNIKKGWNKK